MTSYAQPSPGPVVSSRTPYAPFVFLLGGIIVIALTLRVLNPAPEEPASYPLSGAPVGDPNAAVPLPPVRMPAASLSLVPETWRGQQLEVGPVAFPPGAEVEFAVALTTSEPTFVTVHLEKLRRTGEMASAEPIAIRVRPDESGRAQVVTSVDRLTDQLGTGWYHISMTWQGRTIGSSDVTLGRLQPSSLAIFDEPRKVVLKRGEHTGYRFTHDGGVRKELTESVKKRTRLDVMAYARFNGQPHVLVPDGKWKRSWLPLSGRVLLR